MKFGKSLTQQQFGPESDINAIVARSRANGMLPESTKTPKYLDVTNIPDYQTAQNIVISADNAFMALSAKIRERFQNSPQKMIDFLKDPENLDEAVKLGLVKRDEQNNAKNEPTDQPQQVKKGSKKQKVEKPSSDLDNVAELPLEE